MTIQNKIYNSLIAIGLTGMISGFGNAVYTAKTKAIEFPSAPTAVRRMYEIESEFENITAWAMLENPQLNDKSAGLVGEYNSLISKPIVMQERKKYERDVDLSTRAFGLFGYSLAFGTCSILPLWFGFIEKSRGKEK